MTRASKARRKRILLAYENSLQLARRDVNPNFKRVILRLIRIAPFCGKLDTVQAYFEKTSEVMFDKVR